MAEMYKNIETPVMNLLDDCLIHIFQQLDSRMDRDSFGLTCHRWLHIQNTSRRSVKLCCSVTTYGSSRLTQGSFNVSAFHVYKLLTRFPYLTSLSLSGCTELPDSGLSQLEFFGSSLRSLCLACCFQITDTGFSLVASGCSNLKSVDFYRCNITDIGLTAIAKSCLSLQTVNLSYCTKISDCGVRFLSQKCRQLRSLVMSHCRSITGSGFNGCSETLVHVEADSCKLEPDGISGLVSGGGLEYLNLSGLFWSIHGDGLARIGQGSAVHLRVLNLRMCRDATNEAIMMISKGCPALQEWSLAFCHEITITGWVAIGWNCNNLEVLHVNRCRNFCDRGLQALQDGCKNLSKLHMNHCVRVTQLAVESFKCRRSSVVISQEEAVHIFPSFNFTDGNG
ncbi:hypothetical protein MKW94_029822 [Papaver nudicaule]|uniref:F-box/LRR-repeat protein 15-like leucin rich repeat domain-containing protein n=1 Tax=Papaver nudicaule TaxID=74823 RepID=A0AA41S6X5_PAPNU|nr:hypothetical protein [Papaver nudicaule]